MGLLLTILTLLSAESTATWHADVVELNHVIDCTGREQLAQVIWWRRYHEGLHVSTWRTLAVAGVPQRIGDRWRNRWRDGGHWVEASAPTAAETWTLHDREIEDRLHLPAERRRR